MAYPGAHLLQLTRGGPEPVELENTEHFRLLRAFVLDPAGFVETGIEGADS
jgi:predicted ATPase